MIEAPLQHVHEGDDAERAASARPGGRAEEVDEHGVALGERDGAPGAEDHAERGGRVEHHRPARMVRYHGEGQARQALVACPQQEGEAAHHAVAPRRDIGRALCDRRLAECRRRADEGLELLGHSGAGAEAARPLREDGYHHVAGASHRGGEVDVLRLGRVEEDGEGDDPRSGGGERLEDPGIEAARPRRERAVLGEERLVAPLVDPDHHGGLGPARGPRHEQHIDGLSAEGGEDVHQERGGQDEGDHRGEEATDEQPLPHAPAQRSGRPAQRSGRKNARISLASASGSSMAAKWPPASITVHRWILKTFSAQARGGRTISRGNAA
jgi:hypothetical protein